MSKRVNNKRNSEVRRRIVMHKNKQHCKVRAGGTLERTKSVLRGQIKIMQFLLRAVENTHGLLA